MEVIRGRSETAPPPKQEVDNPMNLAEALDVVNAVLTTQYRAFDRLRATLETAKATAADQANAEAAVAATQKEIEAAKADLATVQKQVAAAKGQRDRTMADLTAKRKSAEADIALAQRSFQDDLARQKADFEAQLAEQARVAQVTLEDSLAGKKRELQGLIKEADAAKVALDSVTQTLTAKQAALTDVEGKLAIANQALDALKARL